MGQGRIDSPSIPSSLAFNELNLLLLPKKVRSLIFEPNDLKCIHLREVLRVKEGQLVDLAVRNGPYGKGRVTLRKDESIELQIEWASDHSNDLYPISLVVGMSRPQTCRKILDQATSLGVSSFSFFQADKSEASYKKSSLWKSGEWISKIEGGVEQAFASYVPKCYRFSNLKEALSEEAKLGNRKLLALDNYEANQNLGVDTQNTAQGISLCVGPERGWSKQERQFLNAQNYQLRHLGPRVLRVETAVVSALGVLVSSFWEKD